MPALNRHNRVMRFRTDVPFSLVRKTTEGVVRLVNRTLGKEMEPKWLVPRAIRTPASEATVHL